MAAKDDMLDPQKLLEGFDAATAIATRDRRYDQDVRQLLLSVVEMVDSLIALETHCTDLVRQGPDRLAASVNVIRRKALRVLGSFAVQPMNALGQTLDLDRHVVVGVREEDVSPDIVLEEVEVGYVRNDRPLRRAKVIVSANSRHATPDDSDREEHE